MEHPQEVEDAPWARAYDFKGVGVGVDVQGGMFGVVKLDAPGGEWPFAILGVPVHVGRVDVLYVVYFGLR